MKEERAAYIQAIRDLDGDLQGRRVALDYVRDSDIWVHGEPARFPYVPYLFDAREVAFLQDRFTPSSPRSSATTSRTLGTVTSSAFPRRSSASSCCPAATTRCFPWAGSTCF